MGKGTKCNGMEQSCDTRTNQFCIATTKRTEITELNDLVSVKRQSVTID